MSGEGERSDEGHENPEKTPFAKYAEELGNKQAKFEGVTGPDEDSPDSDVALAQKSTESFNVEGSVEKDEFEAYAKELQEKYVQDEGPSDPTLVGQGSSDAGKRGMSQDGQASAGTDEKETENREAHLGPSRAPQDVPEANQNKESFSNELETNHSRSERILEEGRPKDTDQGRQSESCEKPIELHTLPARTSPSKITGGVGEPIRENQEVVRAETERQSPGNIIGPYEEKKAIPIKVNGTESPQRREVTEDVERHSANEKPKGFEPRQTHGSDVRKSQDRTPDKQVRAEQSQGFSIPPTSGFTAPSGQTETRRVESPSAESKENIVNLPVRAVRNGEGAQYFPVFNIFKTSIEEQLGTKLNHGGFYHLVGSIEGAFDFDIHRVVKNYVRIMTPLEHRDKVEFGKVYNFSFKSIEEIQLNTKQQEIIANSVGVQYRPLMYRLRHAEDKETSSLNQGPEHVKPSSRNIEKNYENKSEKIEGLGATFNPVIRLQSGRDPRLYFRIDYSSFKQATGIEIEEGGFYKIGGRIEGAGSFQKTLRSMASRQDLPFYIPAHLKDKLEVGKRCEVSVDWIEKIPRPNDWRTGEKVDISTWTWREVASWIDTEGTIHTGDHTRYLAIGQKEKKVIQEICTFLDKEGIGSAMRLDLHTGVYYAMVYRVDHVARIVKNVEPLIRTENKKMEIEAFRKDLAKPRKRLSSSILEARKILGIEPE